MDNKKKYYPETQFGGFTDIDGTIAFYVRVNALLKENDVLLDFGCGRGAYRADQVKTRRDLRNFKGRVRKVIGVDVDESARSNPFIDEFIQIEDNILPLEENSVDLCLCDSVLEHLQSPETFISECRRILKVGGYLCIRTPNIHSYVIFSSKLIPDRYHARVLSKVQENRAKQDVFPTFYRCNSILKIRKILHRHNFDCAVFGYEAEPFYLSFSRVAYYIGVLHQRFAPRFFKPAIFAFAQLRES